MTPNPSADLHPVPALTDSPHASFWDLAALLSSTSDTYLLHISADINHTLANTCSHSNRTPMPAFEIPEGLGEIMHSEAGGGGGGGGGGGATAAFHLQALQTLKPAVYMSFHGQGDEPKGRAANPGLS
ncbi:uncharacterized protein CLUP02_10289 [Colletotrichum lupini]|uniref:Uncharacterized protein n=1 Tax=Colletotrichum lupini TaxID=145971 RepID=A0A9Q8SWI9_9PEZI|nr:uncharacterized protein CLUP02_10289 [Colletotrichum lupini]UQC84793.1 hypothetical protein CLUP02_10289 [Colletotrichum lupini]